MKILLLCPPIREHDAPREFPTGLGLIAQVLRSNGHQIQVLDLNALRLSPGETRERLQKLDFDACGIGGLITVYSHVKRLASLVKEIRPGTPVVMGGGVASSVPELILIKTQADVVVQGEGEETAVELFHALESGAPLSSVAGIYYREDGQVRFTPPRPPISDLDELPFPAWELFPMSIYLRYPIYGIGRDINLITSRGCPYSCTFCYQLFHHRSFRARSASLVIEEIARLKREYDVQYISFEDDLFIASKKRVYQFCDELERRRLPLRWNCAGRVNVVDRELLKRMKSAGCTRILYGLESGSQRILDEYRKGVTVAEAKRAFLLTKEVGIEPLYTFMLGAFGETRETAQETIDLCRELNIPLSSVHLTTPYPGTPLFDEAVARGKLKVDTWDNRERFVESLGDASKLTVNLTEMKDDELLDLRDKMRRETFLAFKRPGLVSNLRRRWRVYGVKGFLNLGQRPRIHHYGISTPSFEGQKHHQELVK
ncbi:MAG: cobalamin B12-binding domain-containing protein [Chloroflexi bacterium]|nr:cobalamin B12-binding domain-containing protein [Chloroflexota bacterium]